MMARSWRTWASLTIALGDRLDGLDKLDGLETTKNRLESGFLLVLEFGVDDFELGAAVDLVGGFLILFAQCLDEFLGECHAFLELGILAVDALGHCFGT